MKRQKRYFDKSTKSLRPLSAGQAVRHRVTGNTWEPAWIVKEAKAPKSYIIETKCGQKLRRNRRHLRPDTATDTSLEEPGNNGDKEQAHDGTEVLNTDIESTEDTKDSINISAYDNTQSDSQPDTNPTDDEPAVTFSPYGRAIKPKIWRDFVSY